MPATWITGGSLSCGLPSAASSRSTRPSDRSIFFGCSCISRVRTRSLVVGARGSVIRRCPRRRLAGRHRRRGIQGGFACDAARAAARRMRPSVAAQFGARHDLIDHAVLEEIFGALEALGQRLADRFLDDPRAGEPDDRAGLGQDDVAEHRERRRHAAGRRIGQHDDVGQPRFLDHVGGDDRARHLHQRQDAFLHARAAGGRNDDQRRLALDGAPRRRDERLADGHPHRAAHEREIERRDDGRDAADPPLGDRERVMALPGRRRARPGFRAAVRCSACGREIAADRARPSASRPDRIRRRRTAA